MDLDADTVLEVTAHYLPWPPQLPDSIEMRISYELALALAVLVGHTCQGKAEVSDEGYAFYKAMSTLAEEHGQDFYAGSELYERLLKKKFSGGKYYAIPRRELFEAMNK